MRSSLRLLVVVAAVVGVGPAAMAGADPVTPARRASSLGTHFTMAPLETVAGPVDVVVEHRTTVAKGRACLSVFRESEEEVDGRARRTVVWEGGCRDLGYRFNARTWRSTTMGVVDGHRRQHVYEHHDGAWVEVASAEQPSRIRLELHWQGQQPGSTGVSRSVGCSFTYSLLTPVWCWPPQVAMQRQATVMGSIHFGAGQLDVPLPPGHPGTMTWATWP